MGFEKELPIVWVFCVLFPMLFYKISQSDYPGVHLVVAMRELCCEAGSCKDEW